MKMLNIYWILTTSLLVWFLFIHSPPYLSKRVREIESYNVPFILHLFGAYVISLACISNSLFTPSTMGGKSKPYHILVGRIGMVGGIIAFI